MDWLPTLAGLVGAPIEEKKDLDAIDGRDLWPLISGAENVKEKPHEDYCYYRENRFQAYRRGEWKLLMYRQNWEIEQPAVSDYRLYNLDSDPQEQSDLADQNPELVEELSKTVDKIRRDLGDAIHNRRGRRVRKAGEVATA